MIDEVKKCRTDDLVGVTPLQFQVEENRLA